MTTFQLDRNDSIRLEEGANFDELLIPNNYYVPSTPIAKTIIGIPVPHPGRLTVLSLMNEVVMQEYLANEGGAISRLWRLNNAGKFSKWYQAAENQRFYEVLRYTDKDYPYAQGFCITDRYIYMCSIIDNAHEIVHKYDKYTLKELGKVTFTGAILHGNDFTWNPIEKQIYCAIGGGSKKIAIFNEELKHIKTVQIPISDIKSLSAIGYDKITGLIAFYGGGNHKLYVIKNMNNLEPIYTCTHEGTENFQGMDFYDSVIYGIYSSGKIRGTTLSGETVGVWDIKQKFGEFENIKIQNGRIYYNAQNHSTGICTLYYSDLPTIIKHPMITGGI